MKKLFDASENIKGKSEDRGKNKNSVKRFTDTMLQRSNLSPNQRAS